jgi:hypothetical protein
MNSPARRCALSPTCPVRRVGGALGVDGRNSRLPEILAFWALWHCRHARPPDAPRGYI